MVSKGAFIESAKEVFVHNFLHGYSKWFQKDYAFIAPAAVEYRYQWLWDTSFHAIVLSHFDVEWAKREIKNLLLAQKEDGFLPHIIFWDGRVLPHWAYIESSISGRPRTSSITQPPMVAIAVEQIYKKSKDKNFLRQVLPKIASLHGWLLANRDPDSDCLLSIISPNESGMDELPVFQYAVGYHGLNTIQLHYSYRKADILNQRYNFNSRVILEKDYFNVEELLFNTVFIESNRSLSRLYSEIEEKKNSDFFKKIAQESEKNLLEKCWNKEDSIFYSLYSKSEKHARVKTVASLIPLFLDGLKGEKLKILVEDHLLNSKEFWTSYPVPSVAKSERYYVPGETPFYKIKLLWRGPTWINTNWFIVKGLQKHGYNDAANTIILKTAEMIEKYGFREYYNPETGQGYRREYFGWSTLIVDMLK